MCFDSDNLLEFLFRFAFFHSINSKSGPRKLLGPPIIRSVQNGLNWEEIRENWEETWEIWEIKP